MTTPTPQRGRVSEPGERRTEQDLAKIISERGYLVMRGNGQSFSPGDVILDCVYHFRGRLPIGQPLSVVCETNYDDYAEQCALVQ